MEKYIKEILIKHDLKVESTLRIPDGGNKRSYIFYVTGPYGKKLTLKIFSSEDQVARERFIYEIDTIRHLRGKFSNGYKSWFPKIVAYSKNSENPYYLYERIEGETLGRFVEDYGFKWGNFRHRNFESFIKFIEKIEDLKIDRNTTSWGSRHARKELQYYFENVKGLLPSDLYDKVNAFYEKYHKVISDELVYSHRDLYPENVLINSPGSSKLVFLDWEYFSRVPLGYNAAFLYLNFWREEYWKAKVFSYFYNKYENDPKMIRLYLITFRFCLMILAIRFIYQIETYGKANATVDQNARLSFLYDLNLALSGEIVKPRNIKFLLNKHDIQKVATEYGLGEVIDFEIFYASKGNTVAKVDLKDGRVLIFRFYSLSRSKALIERELKIFDKLKKSGIETYDITKSPEGSLYIEKEIYGKKRKIAVLSFVKGKKIQKRWANEKAIKSAGAMLRSIHNQNIIHGDYSKENVLFQKSTISGVIDLEWGRNTKSRVAKANDLAKAIALWLIDTRSKLLPDDKFVNAFIEGYYAGTPSKDVYKKILRLTIEKIEIERNIFLTTIDIQSNKHSGARFDSAVNVITDLLSGDIK